jgi:glycosyltransferase involved in cell wall biosynthesis
MRIVYIFRPPRPGVSIEELFTTIISSLPSNIIATKYILRSGPLQILDIIKLIVSRFDIYHITGEVHYIALPLFFKKVVLTIHDLNYYENNLVGVKRFIFKWLWIVLPIYLSKKVVAITSYTKKQIESICLNYKLQIFVINNCTDFKSINYDGENQKKEQKKSTTILHVGTDQNKNLERVLEALNGLQVELIIIGPLSKNQQVLVSNVNFKVKNYFSLQRSIIKELYCSADIISFPSLSEGFGMPIIEGQACNVPIITSNISPMKEVAGLGALLVNPESIEEIRNAFICLISDKMIRSKLKDYGIKNVEKYRPLSTLNEYIKLYKSIHE